MTLLLASLTIALIVNTWLSNTWPPGTPVFALRLRLQNICEDAVWWSHLSPEQRADLRRKGRTEPTHTSQPFARIIAGVPMCRYCLSHWVGFAVVPWLAPWTYVLPAILLANLTLSLWGLVGAASDALTGTR